MCEQMANELRLPLIRLVEGSGGGGSVKTIETTGRANVPGVAGWEWVVNNMGTVPRVALGLGSVAGLGAAHLAAAHYSVMVKDKSALFVAGPPVVERLGQKLTKNELGGWQIQLKAGARRPGGGHRGGSLRVRAALPVLPAVVDLRRAAARPADRRPASAARSGCRDAIPRDIRKPYKMRAIVEAVVDRGSFFEMSRALRPRHHHRAGPPRRLAGGGDGERPVSSTAAPGRPTPARRSSASWTWPRPSTCRWSTWWTARASSSGSRPSRPARSSRACARCRPSGSRPCRGAR